jgi:hypothetical protein
MNNGPSTMRTVLALMCVGEAKDELAQSKDSVQSNSKPNVGTIIHLRVQAGRYRWLLQELSSRPGNFFLSSLTSAQSRPNKKMHNSN